MADIGAVAGASPANDGGIHMDQLLLTVAQCCGLAAIGRTRFYELVAGGEIPVRRIGRKTLVAASDLRDFVQRLPVIEIEGGDGKNRQSGASQ
jgi:excisionase family DNA binding protein